jgi:hypothetical protein
MPSDAFEAKTDELQREDAPLPPQEAEEAITSRRGERFSEVSARPVPPSTPR